jgi:hypothetical protein
MKMIPPIPANRWVALQTELRDLAFVLDRKGNPAAADLASTIAARIGELLTEEPRADHPAVMPASRPYLS